MELTQLKFSVQTQELLDAATAVKSLRTEIGNLNKATQDETKAALDNEKVKQAQAKTEEAVAKAKLASAKATEAEDKAAKSATSAVKENTSVLERQKAILEFMTQGYSKGQATVLAYAKANNTATSEIEELGKVLEVQRKLMGASPFDKSMSGLVALKNQYGEIREAIRQYNADVDLTASQTRELARDKERIIERMKQEGATFTQIKKQIRAYNSAYVEQASKVNALSKAEKERERQMRDTVNAARNVQAAEERLFATVAHLNSSISQNTSLNERAALALGSYERNLRLAGITGEEAAKRLQKFHAAQQQISEAEAKNRAGYVARGIGVQMGDVAVSLASGMNPLTVAIQQGDQIRGLIQQSGLEAAQMAGIMKQAFEGIITSFRDVGVAMGSFVVGGLQTMGRSFVDTAVKLTGLNSALSYLRKNIAETQAQGLVPSGWITGLESLLTRMTTSSAVATTFGVALGALVTTVGAVGIAMYQSAKANDALLISLTTTGAALGMNANEVAEFSEANNKYSTSANELKKAIAELASEGFKNKESLSIVTEAAQRFAHVTGQSLNDVIKEYAKLSKDPVESLIKLGEASGYVEVATIKQVQALIEAGRTSEATELAVRALAKAQVDMASDIESSLSPLSTLYLELKEQASSAWGAVTDFANSESVVQGIRNILGVLNLAVGGFGKLAIAAKFSKDILDAGSIEERTRVLQNYQTALQNWEETYSSRAYAAFNGTTTQTGTGTPTSTNSAQVSLEKQLNEQRKSYMSDSERHEQKMKSFAEMRNKTMKLYVAGSKEYQDNLKIIAELEEAELSRYNEKFNKEKEVTKQKDETLSWYNKTLERFRDLQIQATKAQDDGIKPIEFTTKAYAALLDTIDDPKWQTTSVARKQAILLEWEQAQAAEITALRYKEQKKALEELEKAQENFNKAHMDRANAIQEANAEYEYQLSLLFKTEAEAKAITKEYKLQSKEAAILNKYSKARYDMEVAYNKALEKAYDPAERARVEEQFAIDLHNLKLQQNAELTQAQRNSQLETLQEFAEEYNRAKQAISEAVYDALTGKGKDAAKKLRSYIEDVLKRKFIMPAIDVVINASMNMVLGWLVGGGLSGGDGKQQAGSLGGIYGLLSGLNNINSLYSDTFDKFATGSIGQVLGLSNPSQASDAFWAYQDAFQSTGNAAYLGAAQAVQDVGSAQLTALGSFTKTALPWVSAAYSATQGNFGGLVGAAIGSIVPGIGTALGSAIGSILGGLFGDNGAPKVKVRAWGSINAGEVSLGAYDGGYLATKFGDSGATKRIYNHEIMQVIYTDAFVSALNAINPSYVGGTYAGGMLNFKGKSSNIMRAEAVRGTNGPLIYQFNEDTGKGEADYQKWIEGQLPKLQAALMIDAIRTANTDYAEISKALIGDTTDLTSVLKDLDTAGIQALVDSLSGAVLLFDYLNETMFALNKISAEHYTALLDEAGGYKQLQASINNYYAAYTSETQKALNATNAMKKQFADLGMEMPRTKEHFKQIVESLDLTTEAGRKTFNAMMTLSGAFAELDNLLTRMAFDYVDKAFAGLEASVAKQKKKIEDDAEAQVKALQEVSEANEEAIQKSTELANSISRMVEVISSAVKTLRKVVDPVRTMLDAREFIDQAIVDARAGTLPDTEKLADAISTVLTDSTSQYITAVDYKRAQAIQANKLEELGTVLGEQLTNEELTLKTLKDIKYNNDKQIKAIYEARDAQIAALDDLLEEYKLQIDTLKGIETAVLEIPAAIGRLEAAILAATAKTTTPGVSAAQSYQEQAALAAVGGDTSAANTQAAGAVIAIYDAIGRTGDLAPSQAEIAYWAGTGLSGSDLANAMLQSASTFVNDPVYGAAGQAASSLLASLNGLPGFADGGYYQGGLAIVGEEGPELINFSNPGQVYTASQTSNILRNSDNEDLAQLVERLVREVEMLRYEARATATNTNKMVKQLDRASDAQDSLKVTIVADETV